MGYFADPFQTQCSWTYCVRLCVFHPAVLLQSAPSVPVIPAVPSDETAKTTTHTAEELKTIASKSVLIGTFLVAIDLDKATYLGSALMIVWKITAAYPAVMVGIDWKRTFQF